MTTHDEHQQRLAALIVANAEERQRLRAEHQSTKRNLDRTERNERRLLDEYRRVASGAPYQIPLIEAA